MNSDVARTELSDLPQGSSLIEGQYRKIFEHYPVATWLEDITSLVTEITRLASSGVTDFGVYADTHPEFIDSAAESIIVIDVNQSALSLGEARTKQELLGPLSTTLDLTDRIIRERLRNDIIAIAERQTEFDQESVAVTVTGRSVDVRITAHTIDGSEGSRFMVLCIFDATDLNLTGGRPLEQTMLLDVASDAILVRDMHNRIQYWNRSAENLYGWSSSEALGKDADELLHSQRPEEPKRARMLLMQRGDWSGQLHHVTKDARELTGESRWTLLRTNSGRPKGILSVTTDVTEKIVIEKELHRAQRLESMGSLAGGIAHDLNNVLTPVLVGVEALGLLHTDSETQRTLAMVRSSAKRGALIVRQVLSFARGAEGKRGDIQVRHVLGEIKEITKRTFPKSIEIIIDVPKNLWIVSGDLTELHQVFMNLCVNARDAMPEGGTLTISAENVRTDETFARMHLDARPASYVSVTVEDTGTGMTPEVLDSMFDPFFTTKPVGKGTGLGLSTARSVVKSHGGFLTVYSEPGKGSRFSVFLPSAERSAEEDPDAVSGGLPVGCGETLLVVEDEPALRDIAMQTLESYGYHVLTATDGVDGISVFIQHQSEIDLVITDMAMPFMDGGSMMRALMKIRPDLKVIASSGLISRESRSEATTVGAKAFLDKPYTAKELLVTIRKVLD
ncbi:MAG TPA: ATP-binding protein [Spirochaetia bacterium]|nr:ATP-binding protein [Spirochaetia bacterium]